MALAMNVLPAKKSTLVIEAPLSKAEALRVMVAGAENDAPSEGESRLTEGPPPFWAKAMVERISKTKSKRFIAYLQKKGRVGCKAGERGRTPRSPWAPKSLLAPQ